jgi:hypothetical protein
VVVVVHNQQHLPVGNMEDLVARIFISLVTSLVNLMHPMILTQRDKVFPLLLRQRLRNIKLHMMNPRNHQAIRKRRRRMNPNLTQMMKMMITVTLTKALHPNLKTKRIRKRRSLQPRKTRKV